MQYVSQKAHFSRCRRYRYSLQRHWKEGTGSVCFIGLNPSTADHRQDDPTIRRCVSFARDWGYSAMEIVNLFAFRATFPKDLKAATDPIGPRNQQWLSRAISRNDLAIACWGNDGEFMERADWCLKRFPSLHCIRMNKSQQPAHPLYLPARLKPRPFTPDRARRSCP